MIGVAKTGSGKTIAFLLPMFRHIKDQRPLDPLEGPISLIMTPTRELAVQIHKECKPFLKAANLRVRKPKTPSLALEYANGNRLYVRMVAHLSKIRLRTSSVEQKSLCARLAG